MLCHVERTKLISYFVRIGGLTCIPRAYLQAWAWLTRLAVPLQAVQLRAVPLRAVPLRTVQLRTVPLRTVPLRAKRREV